MNRLGLCVNLFLNAGASASAQLFAIPTTFSSMAFVDVDHSGTPHFEPKIPQNMLAEEQEISRSIKASEANIQHSQEEHIAAEAAMCQKKITGTALDKGSLKYGCSHYRRRCRIRACNEIFDCRHCHNEAKNTVCIDQKLRHDIPRHLIQKVICSLCDTEQEVRQVCRNCGVCMGRY